MRSLLAIVPLSHVAIRASRSRTAHGCRRNRPQQIRAGAEPEPEQRGLRRDPCGGAASLRCEHHLHRRREWQVYTRTAPPRRVLRGRRSPISSSRCRFPRWKWIPATRRCCSPGSDASARSAATHRYTSPASGAPERATPHHRWREHLDPQSPTRCSSASTSPPSPHVVTPCWRGPTTSSPAAAGGLFRSTDAGRELDAG